MTQRRLLAFSWALLGVVVAAALVIGSIGQPAPTPAERVRSLSGQFACPTCAGQSVLYSDAGISNQIRAEIAQRVEAGQSDDQILSFLTQAYGREYLLTPSASGAASLAWALPVFFAVLSLAGLVVAFRRWRPTTIDVTDDERAMVERALRHEEHE
jgi:cytochrome c-type biogenesis protein CcmH